MPWIKLNDNAPDHPKVAGLTDRAFRVWIRSLCYAAQFQTDGILPTAFLATVPRRIYLELVEAGLWISSHTTVAIHDYLKHQSSKELVTRKKADLANRVARHRTRRNGVSNALHPTTGNALLTRPEVEVEVERTPPNLPVRTGRIRVRREHHDQAKLVLRSRLGYCKHDPECPNQVACTERIALEIAEKAS